MITLSNTACSLQQSQIRSPVVAESADCTALEFLKVGSMRAEGRCRRLKVVPTCS